MKPRSVPKNYRSKIVRRALHGRFGFTTLSGPRAVLVAATVCGVALSPGSAEAQGAGKSTKPLPDVLLLVDNSGSMERMPDNTLPSAGAGACNPGTASEPNRWAMLLQALTGNIQPFFSCEALARDAGPTSPFVREFSISGRAPYDAGYFLPYHRPMAGNGAPNACVVAPYLLSGGGGIGPNTRGVGGSASDFPEDALITVRRDYLNSVNQSLPTPFSSISSTDKCIFEQAPDGQLDASRDYVRFGLMTFDNDPDWRTGVTGTNTDLSAVGGSIVQPPFLGQWSYYRDASNPDVTGAYSWPGPTPPAFTIPAGAANGHPTGCGYFSPFEVGARNEFAPPWEGRLVKFPAPDATLYDVQQVNDQIQKVLLASRPYGATPIDGMLDDARDYYWYRSDGVKTDPYKCRDKFIVLLTDGAPNLDMRPSCGATGAGDHCPYPEKAADIAYGMKTDPTTARQVTTYVIGFSVNGSGQFAGTDGFPPGFDALSGKNNCKTWYSDPTGGNGSPTTMESTCNGLYATNSIPAGSTADACCKLNEIARKGSNGTEGPFFAESQADIVLSFGKVMANIIKTATTRTIPVTTPAAQFSTVAGQRSGTFVASFIPNAQRPWSGELDRQRNECAGATVVTPPPTQDPLKGDFMSVNLAAQAVAKRRWFISVKANTLTDGSIDSAATIRPWLTQSGGFTGGPDGIPLPEGTGGTPVYDAREVSMTNDASTVPIDWPKALNIDTHTCKQSRTVLKGGTVGSRGTQLIPALPNPDDCTKVVWGFEVAYPDPITLGTPAYNGFNVRCPGTNTTIGSCSISGNGCTVGGPACPVSGEICVPECSALGAIYRANPTVLAAPSSFLREEGFRSFQSARVDRRQVVFAATTDGVLHAFKAIAESGGVPTGPSDDHELWAFVPPAVLPKLASNYPTGNQVLLDGSPIVRDAVWERDANEASGALSGTKWHSTLVASLGEGGGGYYALNVSDADCGGKTSTNDCRNPANYGVPSNLAEASMGGHNYADATVKHGPHFLWQLTDVLKATGSSENIVRKHGAAEMVALFGKTTGTPAIGMAQIVGVGGIQKQVGIAILPGGIDSPPIKGGSCPRGGGVTSVHDPANGNIRAQVRQWGKTCASPVPGRGVTIVRLDTGEVIRHFGRLNDTPQRLHSRTTDTAFDSPMVGVPVVYPDTIGVPVQKVFIGDADGTMWRIDLTNTDPTKWSVQLFQDLFPQPYTFADSQPISVPPVLSVDDAGQVVVNVATGDQDSIVKNGERNLIYSLREVRTVGAPTPHAQLNWFQLLKDNAAPGCTSGNCDARVTGPMVVFDRTLYFATYTPVDPTASATCGSAGRSLLWGMHFTDPVSSATAGLGGLPRFCPNGSVNAVGTCGTGFVANEPPPGSPEDVVPGVTLTASLVCSATGATDEVGGNGYGAMTPSEYNLTFNIARPSGGAGGTATDRVLKYRRPLPRTSTRIDAWSLVIE